jgi:Tol biopolymer transport system component
MRVSGSVRWPLVIAAFLVLALASCDGNHVVEPPATGVVWTRISPTTFDECLWPDIRFDSLVYSTVQLVPTGGGTFAFHGRIAVSGVDGANPVRLGYPGPAPWNDLRPRWAGSQKIVFMDNRGGTYDIWYKDLVTFDEHRLTNFATHETAPAPRPGTAGLVYVELGSSATTPYDYGRLVLIPDTTATPLNLIYLTPDTLRCGDPDWDPTGTKLCFAVLSNTDMTRHLYTMNLAPGDSLPIQITVGAAHDYQPRWSPDGGRIVFASDRTARWGIWVVHPEGEAKGLKLVSFDDTGAACFSPTWTPDGTGLIVSSDGRGGARNLWLLSNLPTFPF